MISNLEEALLCSVVNFQQFKEAFSFQKFNSRTRVIVVVISVVKRETFKAKGAISLCAPVSYASYYEEYEMTFIKQRSCMLFYCPKNAFSNYTEAVSDLEALLSSFSINKHKIQAFSRIVSASFFAKSHQYNKNKMTSMKKQSSVYSKAGCPGLLDDQHSGCTVNTDKSTSVQPTLLSKCHPSAICVSYPYPLP